jgi:hypothetical protein
VSKVIENHLKLVPLKAVVQVVSTKEIRLLSSFYEVAKQLTIRVLFGACSPANTRAKEV